MAGAILPDSTVIAYGYDADGRRVQQDEDGTITNYLWDETSMYGDVVMEYGSTGTPIVNYTLADGQLLAQDRGTSTYYLADGQSSTRALANGSGTITDTYDYTAFGEIYGTPTGSTINSYLYAGQQFDDLTGLYSMRARYYDPFVGRFLNQDTYPIDYGNPIKLNRYGYTANNPTNFSDPSGLLALETAQVDSESFFRTDRSIESVMVGTAALYCYVLWSLGTYAGEANVCGFQASVTNDGVSFYPFYAPPDTGTPVIDPGTVKPPDVVPDLINGGGGSSGGNGNGGGQSNVSKVVNTVVGTITLIDQIVDLITQPQPEEEPGPTPPGQKEKDCIPGVDPECDEDGYLYFVHGTDNPSFSTIRQGLSSGGELGAGFYTFWANSWGINSARDWVLGNGGDPTLVFVRISEENFASLHMYRYDEAGLDAAYHMFRGRETTGYELIVGPVGKRGPNGTRIRKYELPEQYKFEGRGISLLQIVRIE